MIRNIFIPENIGSYYLLAKRIVGFDIGRTEIYVTICSAKGYKRIIEKCIEEPIESDNNATHEERIIRTLKSIRNKLGKYNSAYVAFPSSSVIFKELSLPFLGPKKVKMVVPFEVESMLPFTLDQAIIDSIITKEDKSNKRTDVMVAAVKKEYISEYLHLFNTAGITIDKITIDMFQLYSLFKSIPSYQTITQTVALVDLELYTTRLALIIDGQLKYIRSLSKGIITIAKKLSASNGVETSEGLRQLMRYGTQEADSSKYKTISNQAITDLFNELNFTIQSITSRLKSSERIQQVILTGTGTDIPGINDVASHTMGAVSEILQVKKVIRNGKIISKVTSIPNSFLISLSTALPSAITEDFNLQQLQANEVENRVIIQQIITFIAVTLLLLSSLIAYSYVRIRNLRIARTEAESEPITELKKAFKLKESQTATLSDANKSSKKVLAAQESTWQQLLPQNRYSLLTYLSQLSKCINPKDIQLTLTQISLKGDTIKLWGEVPSYDQLIKLQHQLKCPLFKNIPKRYEPDFRTEPIEFTVNKDRET
jgi:type IV pilus assembly protein PilM